MFKIMGIKDLWVKVKSLFPQLNTFCIILSLEGILNMNPLR